MNWNFESILFHILLIDASFATLMAYSGRQHWWATHMGTIAKHFPLARGWTLYYLLLTLFIGYILNKCGLLVTLW